MHEMSLVQGVLQLIEDAAARDPFSKVTTVWLEIGQLAGVEPQALAFCFAAVMRGSVAEHAQLELLEVPGVGWCKVCELSAPMEDLLTPCPRCGAHALQVTAGMGLRLKELEVES